MLPRPQQYIVFVTVCASVLAPASGLWHLFDDDGYQFRFGNFLVTQPPPTGNIWAVLVAGSKEWYNYRHQADVCHAYQILHRHGVPDERIIVMMYDDIADNEANPTPGVIINHPEGSDVYSGVKKDYTGEAVNPANFVNVLTGNKRALRGTGSGAVLESTENDHVFVYFADHGAPGLIALPAGEPPLLHARTLNAALQQMADQKMFAKLVFYLEACESGSMFSQLPDNLSVFAVTASNATESSYACYFDQDRGTYLGDTFSVNWMEDSDKENLEAESLENQFEIAKTETNSSHVQQFGDVTLGSLPVAQFQGDQDSEPIFYPHYPFGEVPSENVPLEQLYRQLQTATDSVSIATLQQQIKDLEQKRKTLDEAVDAILGTLVLDESHIQLSELTHGKQEILDYDCYEPVSEAFHQCISFTENNYALRQLYKFVNACEAFGDHERIVAAIRESCTVSGMTGIH